MEKKLVIPERAAGVLLHISSLPGKYGIGTMGKEARAFADFLHAAGVRYWQVLPLVQTGYGDSPYQSVFGASGNPYLIDIEELFRLGLIHRAEMKALAGKKGVDYGMLYRKKYALLRTAFSRFDRNDPAFCAFVEEGSFHEYALFMALKTAHGGASFDRWKRSYRFREGGALDSFLLRERDEYLFWQFVQFTFFRQWKALKAYINGLGIRVIGDLPLYVAYDSADVWAQPQLFKLTGSRKPRKVAGVPPDYFSATGQLWGNPVYDWAQHKETGYEWWIERMRRAFQMYDVVRIDHFRGLDRYYEIDAGEETAVNGKWHRGPGMALFRAAKAKLGSLPLIAEDLGAMDAGVERLLRSSGFPGMKVLQFAFDGDPNNAYLPQNIGKNSVAYTGTHDNDTMVGYLRSLSREELERVSGIVREQLRRRQLAGCGGGVYGVARAIRLLCWQSDAQLAVVPMQDLLQLGSEARMNTPAVSEGNWRFRLEALPSARLQEVLREEVMAFGRVGK